MAEGTEERNRDNGGRPGGNYNHRRRHHGHRPGNNPNRYNNGPKSEGENATPVDGAPRQGNNRGPHYQRRDSYRHHEPVKAVETLEDIQRDIRRIEKEIEMEISEISAAKLGV